MKLFNIFLSCLAQLVNNKIDNVMVIIDKFFIVSLSPIPIFCIVKHYFNKIRIVDLYFTNSG